MKTKAQKQLEAIQRMEGWIEQMEKWIVETQAKLNKIQFSKGWEADEQRRKYQTAIDKWNDLINKHQTTIQNTRAKLVGY